MQATPMDGALEAARRQHLLTQSYETAITLVVAFVVWRLTLAALDRFFAKRMLLRHPRVHTYLRPIKSVIGIFTLGVTIIVLLRVWQINADPAIFSAGLITAALAFGAQSVVRDLLAGYSIFAEEQFEIGDTIEIVTNVNATVGGVVDSVGLRTTRLIDAHGRPIFIPNGNIHVITNLSKTGARLAFLFSMPWRGPVETMQQEMLEVVRAAAARVGVDGKDVDVSLDSFDTKQATLRISIRPPDGGSGAHLDEGKLRAAVAAGLQSKGWLDGSGVPS